MQFDISLPSQLQKWIEGHLDIFSQGNLILLQGSLGAGKTTLVSQVVKALGGAHTEVSSPTFALHQIYQCPLFLVDHMDLYRLNSDEDLESSGFFEVIEKNKNLSFIEWSERIDKDFYQSLQRPVFIIQIEYKEPQRQLSCVRLNT